MKRNDYRLSGAHFIYGFQMTIKRVKKDAGVSDLIGTILIIVLVIGLAAVVAAFLMPNLLHKSAYIASEVTATPITQPSGQQVEVISVLPKSGDSFYIIGQKQSAGGYPISVRALSPDGRKISVNCTDLTGNLYGKQLYVFPANRPGAGPCDMCINDTRPSGAMRPMTNGIWTIQFIDEESHILVMSNSDANITKGTTSLPKVGGMLGGNVYYSNCSTITPTVSSAPVSPALGPGNMSYRTFNGNQYMEYPNDPNLRFTGDLGISIWLDPTNINSGTWNTIIGKGILNPDSSEYDNYQLVAIGNVLYFEWNNADGNHYHSQTNAPALAQGVWQYVTVNVQQNGQPQIYVNGVLQPSRVYTGNVPNAGSLSPTTTVNMQDNNYPVKIGKQNSNSQPFYYYGNIGNLALYNRPLTANEIQQNYQSYSA
jgi:FlaG/FlaF family flagellin (archaellin)